MRFRQMILSLLALSMVAALVACSSSSKPVVQPISVAFSSQPPASMAESAAQSLTAVVSNDSPAAGVTWSVTCGTAGVCGGFSSTSTASGAPTTYTAPATMPSGGTVTITATSVTDATKTASASVTITLAAALADGTYVFSLAGQNAAGVYLYYAAGAFTVSSGTVTAGEQDYVDYANVATLADAITGGSVSATADGNLQVVLNTADAAVGVNGVETLNGTMVSGVRGLITEFDASATSSGELDLQTSTSANLGGYAFIVNGGDSGGCPTGIGGVVNVDGPGTISGAGSVFDLDDCGSTIIGGVIDGTSTTSATDSYGRFTVSLNVTTTPIAGIGLVGYVVDGNRIRLVENSNDPVDANGFYGVTGGTAFAQTGTGGFDAASVEGSSFTFGTNGADINGYFQVAGIVSFNADGTTASGTLNFNDLTGTTAQAPLAFTGTYTVDPTGRVTLTNLTDGVTFSFSAQLYLDGNGHGTVLTVDPSDVVAGYASLQSGGGAFAAGSFSGNYGFGTTGFDWNSYNEFDTVGPVVADGVSALNGTFDQNLLFGSQTAGLTLTDGFSTVDPSGFLTGTMTGLDISFGSTDVFSYYLIDTTKVVAIQTDPNQLTLGYFELQQ